MSRPAFLGFVAAVGVVLSRVGNAASAHADDVTFLSDLKEAGFDNDNGGNSSLITAGHDMCNALAEGSSRSVVAKELFEDSKMDSLADSQQFVGIAIKDLCPAEGS